MGYQIGTLLNINGLAGKVIGFIRYENTQDPGKFWDGVPAADTQWRGMAFL